MAIAAAIRSGGTGRGEFFVIELPLRDSKVDVPNQCFLISFVRALKQLVFSPCCRLKMFPPQCRWPEHFLREASALWN